VIDHEFENTLKLPFFIFSSNESRGISFGPVTPGPRVDVQWRYISLQNFAQSAMADRL